MNSNFTNSLKYKIDLSDVSYNIRIHSPHYRYTGFITPFGSYQPSVIQQGDGNVPPKFQKIMNHLFGDELGIFVCFYIHNMFILSRPYK